MLRLQSVNQFYGHTHILWDINLELPPGQCTCLIGRNGVGKTTLINCIMGHIPVESGTMVWQPGDEPAENLLQQPVERRTALGIGYVPQGQPIFSQLSVEDNLLVALLAGRHKDRVIPHWIYDFFPFLHQQRRQRGGELTRNQQQLLALARALVPEPELLILDEPGCCGQPALNAEIGSVIRQLCQDIGLTVLLVEHRLANIQQVADRFYLIDEGRNVAQGKLALLDDDLITEYLTV
ncbi:ABC transporter ATP-binding protein [Yersinia nurmii]|uniref:ABC transporter ATP-binding protein n=1 Tax=Yersinia nurmii TaxID=685706 RepID=A0AAW7JY26_9GAMM|nr:ABC transporter ATP-binding protein [Yersinia nurmii]MDN0087922.1 ABC transporter ATP-binding protein [Yersinia nurmii]CND97536.1 putative amino acid transporter [Yersinia nurmii]